MYSFRTIREQILSAKERSPLFPYGGALTGERLASLREAPHLKSFLAEMRGAAQRAAATPIPGLTFTLFHTFERTGTRVEYETPYFDRRGRLAGMVLTSVVDRTDEYIEAIENLIWDICGEYTWSLPACLPVGLEACAANRVPPEQVVDLFAAETSHALAETLYLLGDRLNPWIGHRVRSEIERRVFVPMFHDPAHFHWEATLSNWASVCAGAVGMAALLLEDDRERLAGMIERVVRAMECFLEGYGDDGGCTEGIGYWQYGFGYYVYFADMLDQFTGGGLDLLSGEKQRNIAEYPAKIQLANSCFANYSDANSRCGLNTGLVSKLVSRFAMAVPEMSAVPSFHGDHCYRWPVLTTNLLWTDAALLHQPVAAGTFYFPDLGCVLDRRPIGDKTIAFFAKGGHNDEPHNHNDLGHFILHLGGENVLVDLGRGLYTKDYFGPARYSLLQPSSEGHSVAIVNGHPQKAGRTHEASVVRYEREGEALLFKLDLTRAYDDPSLMSYRRAFRWSAGAVLEGDACLELTDTFAFADQPVQLEQLFISMHVPVADLDRIIWLGERGTVVMRYDPQHYEAVIEALEGVQDNKGRSDTIYRVRLRAAKLHKEMQTKLVFHCALRGKE